MVEPLDLETPTNYFVFPVSADEKGRGVIGSRLGCPSYEDAAKVASELMSAFPGVLIFDANDLELVDVFGDLPETFVRNRLFVR
jgi:hypothetical protein